MKRLRYPAQVAGLTVLLLPVALLVYAYPAYAWAGVITWAMFYSIWRIARTESHSAARDRLPERLPSSVERERWSREFDAIVRRQDWDRQ